MSSIDSSDNMDLGCLSITEKSGLPIYWVLGDYPYQHDEYSHRVANGDDICFGGGSGEHPCLMVGVADSLIWLAHTIDAENEESIKSLEPLLEAIVPFINGYDSQHDTVSGYMEEVYYRKPNFEVEAWPLPTWSRTSRYFSQVLGTKEDRFEFHDIMTVLALVIVKTFPWQYCDNSALVSAYNAIKPMLISQNSAYLFKVGGKEFVAAELFELVNQLIKKPDDSMGFMGRCLKKVPGTNEIRVSWGFSEKHMNEAYLKYSENPLSEEIPIGLEKYLKAKTTYQD